MPGLIELELYDQLTGEIVPLGHIPQPETPAARRKVVQKLRNLGVTEIHAELAQRLGLPDGYRMVPLWRPSKPHTLEAWSNALAAEKFVKRTDARERSQGVPKFGQQIDGQGRRKREPK